MKRTRGQNVQAQKAQRQQELREKMQAAKNAARRAEAELQAALSRPVRTITAATILLACSAEQDATVSILAKGLTADVSMRLLWSIRRVAANEIRGKEIRARRKEFGVFLGEILHKAPKLLEECQIGALGRLFGVLPKALRPLSEWAPGGHSITALFRSLVNHLLVKYPVPGFLYSTFDTSEEEVRLFVHLAAGGSVAVAVKEGLLPVPLTAKMCHLFRGMTQAHSVIAAVRLAQVKALGGSVRLARAVCGSYLGRTYERNNEAFWLTVLQWLCAQNGLDPVQVSPLVDYLSHCRYDNAGFSMKGRSALALLRGMEEWHRELRDRRKSEIISKDMAFVPSGIPEGLWDLSRKDDNGQVIQPQIWTVTEILTAEELAAEGRAMRHCVYSYAPSVAAKRVSIWSLRRETFEPPQRLLTIEVDNARKQIVQARGVCNQMAGYTEQQMVERWAHEAGLQLGAYVWQKAW